MPRKNLHPLAGVPLLVHTIRAALGSRRLTDLVVTTDDPEIRRVAIEAGAPAPFLRPAELSTDEALAVPTIQHAVREMESRTRGRFDVVIMLQPTAPLRTSEDIDEALDRLLDSTADGIISICDVNNFHPMKMKRIVDGKLVDYQPPPVENPPRQSLPPVHIVNGAIYATRRDVLLERGTFKGDHCLPFLMPPERSVNVDAPVDFLVAEHHLEARASRRPAISKNIC